MEGPVVMPIHEVKMEDFVLRKSYLSVIEGDVSLV